MTAQARQHSENARVFTFGLGSGCDKLLCESVAKTGRGTCSIVADGGSDLNGQVIKALSNAMEPSLKDCSVKWSDQKLKPLHEVFRNQSICETKICDSSDFDRVTFSFNCLNDPTTEQPIDLNFTSVDF